MRRFFNDFHEWRSYEWKSLANGLRNNLDHSSNHKDRRVSHDDPTKWKHFLRYWPFVQGIHRSSVNSPHKGHWRGTLMFSLICTWTYSWVKNRDAGDLRRHRASMKSICTKTCNMVTLIITLATLSKPSWTMYSFVLWTKWYISTSDRHRLDIDSKFSCRIDVLSMPTRESLSSLQVHEFDYFLTILYMSTGLHST